MNSTSCGSRLVSSAARSPARSSTGTGRLAQVDAELVRDDVRQRRLAEARRTEQQHVIERFLALSRRLDEDRQLAADLLLPDVFVEQARAQRALDDVLLHADHLGGDEAVELVVFDGHVVVALLDLGQELQRLADAVTHARALGQLLDCGDGLA